MRFCIFLSCRFRLVCYLLQNLLPQCCGTILWENLSYVKRTRIFNRPVQICASLYKGAWNVFSLDWLFPFYVKLIFLNRNNHFLYYLQHCYELVYCKNLRNSSIIICMHSILNFNMLLPSDCTGHVLHHTMLVSCVSIRDIASNSSWEKQTRNTRVKRNRHYTSNHTQKLRKMHFIWVSVY